MATTVPNCVAYDPTYAYELAVIVQDGLRRMYAEQENVFYYVTCMNENYAHPAMPAGAEEGILKGMYLLRSGGRGKVRVNLLGSGTILREVLAAAELLEQEFGVPADVFSVPSFSELRREALDVERWNLLHPAEPPRTPYVRQCLDGRDGPFVAATDYMRAVARPGPPVGARAAITCSAPTAMAVAIRAPRCAASSRWTGAGSRSRRSRRWPTMACSTSRRSRAPSSASASTPTSRTP